MTKLGVSITYYLRRLLRQHEQNLTSVICPGAGLVANGEADLDAVLDSLYPDEEENATIRQQLETLVLLHQHSDRLGAPQQAKITAQIFWLLGVNYPTLIAMR
ncbi:hypothetical protein RYO59_000815 [Thermosynechococcaceae cyanobacterium Okahandja]